MPGRWVESSIHPDRYWSFRMLTNKVWRLLTMLVGAALSAACVPSLCRADEQRFWLGGDGSARMALPVR